MTLASSHSGVSIHLDKHSKGSMTTLNEQVDDEEASPQPFSRFRLKKVKDDFEYESPVKKCRDDDDFG